MFDKKRNRVFLGGEEKLSKWDDKPQERLKLYLKNYLELDNVSFLFGAGSSIALGSVSIANIPVEVEERIKEFKEPVPEATEEVKDEDESSCYSEFLEIVSSLQKNRKKEGDDSNLPKRNDQNEIVYPLEELLNYLSAIKFIQSESPESNSYEYIDEIIQLIKAELFELCDLDKREPNPSKEYEEEYKTNKYHFHEKLIKKILQRPLNLKRANIFTTNYDVAFEYAFDKLGIQYIDGFSGFNRRTLKPEVFDHDIFFPGSTTQGKVHRIEKVLKYYKLHGSLTWYLEEPTPSNVYGIREYPVDYVRKLVKEEPESAGKLMIYPTTEKKSHSLDFPYSELLRQFANVISQPQSVLITFGYSFRDEHINDIIHQALSIPSFTLVIVDFKGREASSEIKRLNSLNDPRIIILEGEQLGDFPYFVEKILPDIIESKEEEKIAQTLKTLYHEQDKEFGDSSNEGKSGTSTRVEETDSTEDQNDGKESDFDDMDADDLPF